LEISIWKRARSSIHWGSDNQSLAVLGCGDSFDFLATVY
jgi:hypothetical protein